MTMMMSFRLDAGEAESARSWAERLGIDRSELLREALRRHLQQLDSEAEAASWVDGAPDDAEPALAAIADWGPAEDWSDWADAEG